MKAMAAKAVITTPRRWRLMFRRAEPMGRGISEDVSGKICSSRLTGL